MNNTKKVSDLVLENGNARYGKGRTVMSETGLSPDTRVRFHSGQTRVIGTGYRNSIFRILREDDAPTDDALIIRHNDGPATNVCWDNVLVKKGYFAEQRRYGIECTKMAHKLGLPREVCLAFGPELCKEFKTLSSKVRRVSDGKFGSNTTGFARIRPYRLDKGAIGELSAGAARRKWAILALMPDMSEALRDRIESFGQVNSTRVAKYLAAKD